MCFEHKELKANCRNDNHVRSFRGLPASKLALADNHTIMPFAVQQCVPYLNAEVTRLVNLLPAFASAMKSAAAGGKRRLNAQNKNEVKFAAFERLKNREAHYSRAFMNMQQLATYVHRPSR